jgi:hypothetical protein
VGTYAYVNPVIAVGLGYFFGGEAVGARTLLGTLLVLVSVITITTTPKENREFPRQPELSVVKADENDVYVDGWLASSNPIHYKRVLDGAGSTSRQSSTMCSMWYSMRTAGL